MSFIGHSCPHLLIGRCGTVLPKAETLIEFTALGASPEKRGLKLIECCSSSTSTLGMVDRNRRIAGENRSGRASQRRQPTLRYGNFVRAHVIQQASSAAWKAFSLRS
jgi:hypothetical protein